jgi:hypothetical protein
LIVMVRDLLVLDSSAYGARDLWWPRDLDANRGYNVYRADDAPVSWRKLNPFPIPGQYYRDMTQLKQVSFVVQPEDWVDNGEMGLRCIKLPDTPYSEVILGRAIVATAPQDVHIEVAYPDGSTQVTRAAMVSGVDQLVWAFAGTTLPLGGAVSNFPLIDFNTAVSFTVTFYTLANYVDIQTNLRRTFYTVVPIGPHGEMHAPGAPPSEVVNTLEIDKLDYIMREMIRRNAWEFEQVGEPAYLMIRRTAGLPCSCSDGLGRGRSACPSCYETGIVGGYYGPIDFTYIDPDSGIVRTIDEGGQKVERTSKSYLGRTPIIQDGDLIVRRNGERLVIAGSNEVMMRGVLLQQEFDVQLLNPGDARYTIPLFNPQEPILYNPSFSQNPGFGTQPVYDTRTDPNSNRDREEEQVGRTTVFGNIQR